MRMNRLITGLVAMAMVGFAPIVVASQATASSGTLAETSTTTTATDARMARQERSLNPRIVSSSRRILAGKVTPKPGKRLRIIVKRAKRVKGNYRKVRTFKTRANGKWRVQLSRERGYVKLVLKGNRKYKKAVAGPYVIS